MSAAYGALCVALVYRLGRRLGANPVPAAMGAAALGTSPMFWSNCTVAEVYTPGMCALIGVFLLLLKGHQTQRAQPIFLAALLAGAGLGFHYFLATCGLGFVCLVLAHGLKIQHPRDLKLLFSGGQWGTRLKVASGCAGATMVGAMVFLLVPLRAQTNPAVNFAEVTDAERFFWLISGGNYKGWFLKDYDLAERGLEVLTILVDQVQPAGLLLALLGLAALIRRLPVPGVAIILAMAGNLWFFFDYGVHDWEVFFLPSVALLCVASALGLQAAVDWSVERWQRPELQHMAWLFLLLPFAQTLSSWADMDRSGQTDAHRYGEAICEQLPENAVLVRFTTPGEWRYDSVFTAYFQGALKRRRDVQIMDLPTRGEIANASRQGAQLFVLHPEAGKYLGLPLKREGLLFRVITPPQ